MKIHRLILIEDHATGRQLAAVQDVVSMEQAKEFIDVAMLSAANLQTQLHAGLKVHLDYTFAGVRVHGHLVAATAPNNHALQARKAEARL